MQFARLGVEAVETEGPGEVVRLIGFRPMGGHAQHFLQGDNVSVDLLENAGDPLGTRTPVHALALMDVVSGDAKRPHTWSRSMAARRSDERDAQPRRFQSSIVMRRASPRSRKNRWRISSTSTGS